MVRFTDIRSGLGRTSLSTSFEEKSSPTDVTLRNITKTLCSPRCGTQTPRCGTQTPLCGTQTPRSMRRFSAGVPPTSSVARKMEFSPQVKKRRNDINRYQRRDSISTDDDILLSSSIFDDDGSDEYAIVPKPTRNLHVPDFLLPGGTCRSESVNYRTTCTGASEVCATLRTDCHMGEPFQLGIVSLDVGPGTGLNTNSLPSGLSVTHATHLSQPEFITMSPSSNLSSNFGLSTACYHSAWPNTSYSSTALPHINTFSHMAEGSMTSPKSAFKPVVRSGHSTSPRMDSQQYTTPDDSIGFPLSVTPAMHKAFAPFDIPCSLPSPFLLSPTLTGLEQLCYPNNTFVPNREIKNCSESEDRLDMTTPVLILDHPVNTPDAREDKMSLAVSSIDHSCLGSSSATVPGMLPNLYPFDAQYQANMTSCKVGIPDLPTYHLPIGETRNAVQCDEGLIGAGSCFCSDIQLHHAECSSPFHGKAAIEPIPVLQRNCDAGDPFLVLHNRCDAVDPPEMMLNNCDTVEVLHNKCDHVNLTDAVNRNGDVVDAALRRSGDGNTENETVAMSDTTRSRRGGLKKKKARNPTWSKPVSVRETLENRRRRAADCNLAITTAVGSVCSDVSVAKPTVTLSGRSVESSTASLKCLNAKQNGVVLPCAGSPEDPASDISTKTTSEQVSFDAAHLATSKGGISFGWNQTQSLQSDSRLETKNSTAKTTVCPALRSVPSDVGDEFALIGEPQICKRPCLSHYNSHIRNPKKEMIQRQVFENNHRLTKCEKDRISNSVTSPVSHPTSCENGFNTSAADTRVDAVDLSKNTIVDRKRREATIQSMVSSPGVTSASPIYPYLLNVTREYEMLLLAGQLSANSLHVAFSQGGANMGQYTYAQKIVSVQNNVTDRYADVATVSSSSDPVETSRSKHPVFARLNDEPLGNVLLKYL